MRTVIANLKPSPFALEQLPGAELTAELEAADVGHRLILRMVWDEPQRRNAPLTMATWIYPTSETIATTGNEEPGR